MSDEPNHADAGAPVRVCPGPAQAEMLVVCEHASNAIPDELDGLGLPEDLLTSHIAWDPGALGVARELAALLSAPLVHGTVSRLVYDCNRPPESPGAVPEKSEIHVIPGNAALVPEMRRKRAESVYFPFRDRLASEIAGRRAHLKLLITVHSFTPVYFNQSRDVEIGILHGTDARFAVAMLANPPSGLTHDVRLNAPYGPQDGVAHTLDEHGPPNGLLSVMLEIRNDLIATEAAERAMAALLAGWIGAAFSALRTAEAAG